uniref:Uncharacterized protein n=1 Tax=Timema poppense TaxID=170557 RepID=A0A7R9DKZ3_TIMPO|nr:unnamed protein product [Timema poppensis]
MEGVYHVGGCLITSQQLFGTQALNRRILAHNAPLYDINSKLEELVQSIPDKKLHYVALRGTVKAIGSPIKSLNSSNVSGVVQKLSIKEHVMTRSTAGFCPITPCDNQPLEGC